MGLGARAGAGKGFSLLLDRAQAQGSLCLAPNWVWGFGPCSKVAGGFQHRYLRMLLSGVTKWTSLK